ncbi:Osmoprotectant transporter OS=Streptomyces glaucescens OX=1907 GN=SGLAU_01845 PE=4 SV=1 [Streptomyces glaucescens]
MPAYYATGAAVIGVIAVLCMKETANKPLAGSPPCVETEAEAAELVQAQSPSPRF